MPSARVSHLPVFNSAESTRHGQMTNASSSLANAGSPLQPLQLSPGDPMDISPIAATATTLGTEHAVSAAHAAVDPQHAGLAALPAGVTQSGLFATQGPTAAHHGVPAANLPGLSPSDVFNSRFTTATQPGIFAPSAAGLSPTDVFNSRFTTATQPGIFATSAAGLNRNGFLAAQPGPLAVHGSRTKGPFEARGTARAQPLAMSTGPASRSALTSSSATAMRAGRSTTLLGLRGSLNTVNTLDTRNAFTSFGARDIGSQSLGNRGAAGGQRLAVPTGPAASATTAASSSVTGRPAGRSTGLLSHFLTGSDTTPQTNGQSLNTRSQAGPTRIVSSHRSSRNGTNKYAYSIRGPSTALRPATNNLLNARAGSDRFSFAPYRRPVTGPRLLGQQSGQNHPSIFDDHKPSDEPTPRPKLEVERDMLDASRARLFATSPRSGSEDLMSSTKASRKRSMDEADIEAIRGREGAMGLTPFTAVSSQSMPGSWPESSMRDASDQSAMDVGTLLDQQVMTPAQSWVLMSVCRTIKKFFRRTGLVADTVRSTARYATTTANSVKRRAVELFTTHTHVRRRPAGVPPVASRKMSEIRRQSRRTDGWILESERTTSDDVAVSDIVVPTPTITSSLDTSTALDPGRGPIQPPSPLAATQALTTPSTYGRLTDTLPNLPIIQTHLPPLRTIPASTGLYPSSRRGLQSTQKRTTMAVKMKKQLDERKKVRTKHRHKIKRAKDKQPLVTAAPEGETRMYSELAPYLTPLILETEITSTDVEQVDVHEDAEAAATLTQTETAEHEELEPLREESIVIEQPPEVAEMTVNDIGNVDAATQLRTELNAQAVAIEAELRREDDGLGRLLQSEHPFGRPVSAVRLFGPEPDVLPEGRTASIYADEWREMQAAQRIEEQTPSRIKPQGPAVLPLPAQWEERVERMKEMPNSKQVATTLSGDPLTKHTFATCYTPLAWLNDEIINAYMTLLISYLRESAGNAGRHDKPRFHAFNSFFFSNLRDKGYESVRRWATRAKIGGKDLLDVDTVFIPVHHASHWTLIVVKPTARTIEHFDSLGSLSARHVGVVQEWLRVELGSNYVPSEWRVLPSCSPQQDNGSDCGVFLLSTAKAVALDIDPMSYGANDTPLLRRKICAELLNGGLDGDFVPNGAL